MHEYAHQKVANHQKEFYQLLKKNYPNYLKLDQALKKTVIHF
jgi:predicted metal-dependent hydrolase